jgi:hypothetical protein
MIKKSQTLEDKIIYNLHIHNNYSQKT